mgnify:CR=1 FL=1
MSRVAKLGDFRAEGIHSGMNAREAGGTESMTGLIREGDQFWRGFGQTHLVVFVRVELKSSV